MKLSLSLKIEVIPDPSTSFGYVSFSEVGQIRLSCSNILFVTPNLSKKYKKQHKHTKWSRKWSFDGVGCRSTKVFLL